MLKLHNELLRYKRYSKIKLDKKIQVFMGLINKRIKEILPEASKGLGLFITIDFEEEIILLGVIISAQTAKVVLNLYQHNVREYFK